jgi:2-methylaconitate cis-trans-isomerase PrpF
MFQSTAQRNVQNEDQDQQKREQERKAGNLTDETRNKMLRDTEIRSYESKALAITGRLQESNITERPGTAAQKVAQAAEQEVMPRLEHDLSQLEVPLAQDTRWTVRDAARRAIMQRASEIEAQHNETLEIKPTKMA